MIPESITSKHYVFACVVFIVIVIGAYFLFASSRPHSSVVSAASSTDTDMIGSGTIKELPTATTQPEPDYKAPLSFSQSVSADVRTALNTQLAVTQKAIASDATSFDAWINLGMLRKMAGDYAGAARIWEYVAALYPTSSVPFENLGSLYLDFIKDYPKAEADYKQAIKNYPADINAYEALASLYTTYGYKSGTNADEVLLKAGIAANPKSYELHVLLARYYKSMGNSAAAKAQYQSAISLAISQGNSSAASALTAESSSL